MHDLRLLFLFLLPHLRLICFYLTFRRDCSAIPGALGAANRSLLKEIEKSDTVFRCRRWIRECRHKASHDDAKLKLQPERDVVDEWMRKRDDTLDVFENVKVPAFPQSGSPEDISKYIEMREMGTVTKSSLVQWLFNMLKDPAIFTLVFRQILDIAAQVINFKSSI